MDGLKESKIGKSNGISIHVKANASERQALAHSCKKSGPKTQSDIHTSDWCLSKLPVITWPDSPMFCLVTLWIDWLPEIRRVFLPRKRDTKASSLLI